MFGKDQLGLLLATAAVCFLDEKNVPFSKLASTNADAPVVRREIIVISRKTREIVARAARLDLISAGLCVNTCRCSSHVSMVIADGSFPDFLSVAT
jgi:hypothetical protein